MKDTPGLAGSLFSRLAEQGVNIDTISAGSSRVAFNFIVRSDVQEKAFHVVHDLFFGETEAGDAATETPSESADEAAD